MTMGMKRSEGGVARPVIEIQLAMMTQSCSSSWVAWNRTAFRWTPSKSLVLCLGDETGVDIRDDEGAELEREPERNLPIRNFVKENPTELVVTEDCAELWAALLGVGDDAEGSGVDSFK